MYTEGLIAGAVELLELFRTKIMPSWAPDTKYGAVGFSVSPVVFWSCFDQIFLCCVSITPYWHGLQFQGMQPIFSVIIFWTCATHSSILSELTVKLFPYISNENWILHLEAVLELANTLGTLLVNISFQLDLVQSGDCLNQISPWHVCWAFP